MFGVVSRVRIYFLSKCLSDFPVTLELHPTYSNITNVFPHRYRHKSKITCLEKEIRCGEYVVSADDSGCVMVWNPESGHARYVRECDTSVAAVSMFSNLLVVGTFIFFRVPSSQMSHTQTNNQDQTSDRFESLIRIHATWFIRNKIFTERAVR